MPVNSGVGLVDHIMVDPHKGGPVNLAAIDLFDASSRSRAFAALDQPHVGPALARRVGQVKSHFDEPAPIGRANAASRAHESLPGFQTKS